MSMFNHVVQSVRQSMTSFTPLGTNPQQRKHADDKIRRLSVVTYGDDRFNPQRVQFSWLKLICATRDVGDDANLAQINERQWQIGLNTWRIIIEPELARKVFHKMLANNSSRGKKMLVRGDFVGSILSELGDRRGFEHRVRMTRDGVDELVFPVNEDPLVAVLTSKIIFSLLEGVPLNIFEWTRKRSSFGMDISLMRVEDLLNMVESMEDCQWHDKVDIMQQIASRDAVKNDWTVETAYNACMLWSQEMGDERSQLVRVACETCPVLVRQMLEQDMLSDSHMEIILDGLALPIRATRSRQVVKLGTTCGEEIIDSLLSKTNGTSVTPLLVRVVELLCEGIGLNAKYGSVKRAYIAYTHRIFLGLVKENSPAALSTVVQLVDGTQDTARFLVGSLDATLSDKHPAVRDAAFVLTTLLDGITSPQYLTMAIQGNILSKLDAQVRLRFERRKMKSTRQSKKNEDRRRVRPRAQTNPPKDFVQEFGVDVSEEIDTPPKAAPERSHTRALSIPFPPLSLW